MIETSIQVKLDRFEGPLGLLLQLIQKEEMSIRDLNINQITNQYLDYLQKLQNIDFDIAGEYLYMAATLLYIKSKNCVGPEDQKALKNTDEDFEITTREQLIEKLENLQRFQNLGEKLWALPRRGEDIFVKPKVDRKAIQNSILAPMDLQLLTETMVDLIRREKRKYTVIHRDRLSIKEKLLKLKEYLKPGTQTTLEHLLDTEDNHERDDIVITFISLLELARLQKLEVFQNTSHGDIYVDVKEDLDSFDVETADGFEPEEQSAEGLV